MCIRSRDIPLPDSWSVDSNRALAINAHASSNEPMNRGTKGEFRCAEN